MAEQFRNMKNSKGFTLIELVVVCVILTILMALAVPAGMRYMDGKKADQCQANRKSLVLYLETARLDNPSKGMAEIINEHQGEIACPSGGTYLAADSNTVTCDKHGADYTLSADAGETIASVSPADPGTDAPTPVPGTTEDLLLLGGNYEHLYAKQLNGDVSLTVGMVFVDENKNMVVIRGGIRKKMLGDNPEKNKISDWGNGVGATKEWNVLVIDPENIVTKDSFNSVGNDIRNRNGTVFYFDGKYYVRQNPGDANNPPPNNPNIIEIKIGVL